jgi:hypothetical protein
MSQESAEKRLSWSAEKTPPRDRVLKKARLLQTAERVDQGIDLGWRSAAMPVLL